MFEEFPEPKPIYPVPMAPPKAYYGNESIWGNATTPRGKRWVDNRVNFLLETMKFMTKWQQKTYAGKHNEVLEYFDTDDDGDFGLKIKEENFDFTTEYGPYSQVSGAGSYYHEGSWHSDDELEAQKTTGWGDKIFFGVAGGYYFGGIPGYEKVRFNDGLSSFQHSTLDVDDADFDGDGEIDGQITDSLSVIPYYNTLFYPGKRSEKGEYDSNLMGLANPVDYSEIWGPARDFVANNAKSWGDESGAIASPSIYQLANSKYSDTEKFPTSGNVPAGYDQYDYRHAFSEPKNAFYLAVTMLESFRRIAYFMTETFGAQYKYYYDTNTLNEVGSKDLDEGMMNNFNYWLYGIDDEPEYDDYKIYNYPDEDNWRGSETGMLNKYIYSMALKMQHHLLSTLYAYFYGDSGNTLFMWPFTATGENYVAPDQETLRVRDFRYWLAGKIGEYYNVYKNGHNVEDMKTASRVDDYYNYLKNEYDRLTELQNGNDISTILGNISNEFTDFVKDRTGNRSSSQKYLEIVTAGFNQGYDYEEKDDEGEVISSWEKFEGKLSEYAGDWSTNAGNIYYKADGKLTEAGKAKFNEIKEWLYSSDSSGKRVLELIRTDNDEDGYSDYLFDSDKNARGMLSLLEALKLEEEYIAQGNVIGEFNAEFSMGNTGNIYDRGKEKSDKTGWETNQSLDNRNLTPGMNAIYDNYSKLSRSFKSENWGWDQTLGRNVYGDKDENIDKNLSDIREDTIYGDYAGNISGKQIYIGSSHFRHNGVQFQYWANDSNNNGQIDFNGNELDSFWQKFFQKGAIFAVAGSYYSATYKKVADKAYYSEKLWGVHNMKIMEDFMLPASEQAFAIGMDNSFKDFRYESDKAYYEARKNSWDEEQIASYRRQKKAEAERKNREVTAQEKRSKAEKASKSFQRKLARARNKRGD
jgi:hypothetical protein